MTEESPSETSSEVERLREKLAEMQVTLDWNVAILAVVLQQEGGVIEIDSDTLKSIDLRKVGATVRKDEERDVWIVEGTYDES